MDTKALNNFWKKLLIDQYEAFQAHEKNEAWVINDKKLFEKALFFTQEDKVIEINYLRNNITNFITILNYLPFSKSAYILQQMEKYNGGVLLSIITILNTNSSIESNHSYIFKNRIKNMLAFGVFNNVCPIGIKELIHDLIKDNSYE